MRKSMIIGEPAIVERTSDIQSNTQQPAIWFVHEDVQDTDEPYIIPLLEDSFHQWVEESVPSSMLGTKILFDVSGRQLAIGGHHKPDNDQYDRLGQWVSTACETMECFQSDEVIIVPLKKRSSSQAFAALAWYGVSSNEWILEWLKTAALHYISIFYHRFEHVFVRDLMQQQQFLEKDASRRDKLYKATKRLHDQIDVSSVVGELLDIMEKCYPYAAFTLYLSQDFVDVDQRIKPLFIRNNANDLYEKAFLESKPNLEFLEDGTLQLGIPMSGKQAVYGVLGITMKREQWDESEIGAYVMLAGSAGSAFENAKLYEQSNLLIGELQLINELTQRLNQSLRLDEIFEFTTKELLHIFKADYCCVLQLNRKDNLFQVMSSNFPVLTADHVSIDFGYSGIVYQTKEPVIVSDYWSSRLVQSQMMESTRSRSLIATPIMANSELVGVIMVAHQSPHFFSYENYKLIQVLSTHIGLAISNASLHAEVRRMVITDNLTGLHVRHYLNEKIQSRQRKDRNGSLVLVDIDHFKKVNDTYGHQVGDQILIAVSEVIRSVIRESDIAARWGGEELAVYLPQIRSKQAYKIAERIRSRVEESTSPRVTVSCGLSEWTCEDEKISVESLFYRADMALYEAKNGGRNQIVVDERTDNGR
ncbi:sensor domain-containing diguanylate cyclase [Paenibacillus spongiae]|uniref:Sensor domain-containing diguanylate cyclase n=1 Tax=Paenibacillus spongiae TaxID=2909671 RepID=A0ABY5S326_9BACL|nr:sensor domain-containing diguanylate cyclase [Paenibacillus spongiae]UVI27863.1 sensor domain-containing diguanylate cyclase [Paenibacillus spongiae]